MNLPKSSRYHRAKRRADAAAVGISVLLLTGLLATRAAVSLREAVGGSAAAYAVVLLALIGGATLPLDWYRGYRLEREYGLSKIRGREWVSDRLKAAVVTLAAAAPLAAFVDWSMQWPAIWWLIAALGCGALMTMATAAGPVLIVPLTHRSRPLARDALRRRLERLSAKAGVAVLSVHELALGDRTRRASAALVGTGATRRILLSDTLLADYSDDEIEIVMAHEMGHHVHGDVLKASVAEMLLLLAGFGAAAAALESSWRWLGLASPADPAGMPVVLMTVGGVLVAAAPFLNSWSRSQERSADRFALETASEPGAFIPAVRRMAAQNLAEERPSNAAFLFFHTHPTAEERIASARDVLAARGKAVGLKSVGSKDPTLEIGRAAGIGACRGGSSAPPGHQ